MHTVHKYTLRYADNAIDPSIEIVYHTFRKRI
jgi:hypothetical protein